MIKAVPETAEDPKNDSKKNAAMTKKAAVRDIERLVPEALREKIIPKRNIRENIEKNVFCSNAKGAIKKKAINIASK